MTERKMLARQLREDSFEILAKLKLDGESIAARMRRAAELLSAAERGSTAIRKSEAW